MSVKGRTFTGTAFVGDKIVEYTALVVAIASRIGICTPMHNLFLRINKRTNRH